MQINYCAFNLHFNHSLRTALAKYATTALHGGGVLMTNDFIYPEEKLCAHCERLLCEELLRCAQGNGVAEMPSSIVRTVQSTSQLGKTTENRRISEDTILTGQSLPQCTNDSIHYATDAAEKPECHTT